MIGPLIVIRFIRLMWYILILRKLNQDVMLDYTPELARTVDQSEYVTDNSVC